MIGLFAAAFAAPPAVVVVGEDSPKVLSTARKLSEISDMPKAKAKDVGLGAYLGTWGDLCSVKVSDDAADALNAQAADRPELWVARGGETGIGVWKWEGGVLQRHLDSKSVELQGVDVVMLTTDGATPTELPKKSLKALVHTDVAVRAAPDTAALAKTMWEQKAECIPGLSEEEVAAIKALATTDRPLYLAISPGKGDTVMWRWDPKRNGLRRI